MASGGFNGNASRTVFSALSAVAARLQSRWLWPPRWWYAVLKRLKPKRCRRRPTWDTTDCPGRWERLPWRWRLAELAENDSTPRRSASYPVVIGVAKCSPAVAAGLRVGDVIEKVDGRDARLLPLFGEAVNGPGAVHQLVVRRDDKLLETTMTRTKQLGEHEKPSDRC